MQIVHFLSSKSDRVLIKKVKKYRYSACGVEKDINSSDHRKCPSMIIYSYERIPVSIYAAIPDELAIGKSESGWMSRITFYEYISNIWLEQTNIKKTF